MRKCPFGKNWEKRFLQALKLALEREHITKYSYDKFRKEFLDDVKSVKKGRRYGTESKPE